MKKILVIASKNRVGNPKKRIHYNWIDACSSIYNISLWGSGYGGMTLQSLKNKIDSFKPDFIYLTHRNAYKRWLPDLSGIKNVLKIFVEVDSYKWHRNNPWYSQFDKIYTRQNIWKFKSRKPFNEKSFYQIYKIIGKIHQKKYNNCTFSRKKTISIAHLMYKKCLHRKEYAASWNKTKLFRWSISEHSVIKSATKRKGVYFTGRSSLKLSPERYFMDVKLKNKIILKGEWDENKYNKILRFAAALVCPTGSIYGDYVPAKMFEFLASGAAVLTNCDLVSYGCPDLQRVVIPYTDLTNLESKLNMDFSPYYGKAAKIMRNHTHKIRYKELFG